MLSNQGIGIENASAETGDSSMYGVIYLTLLVENRINLAGIMKKLRQIEEVYRVNRQP
jgi:(p)ppGpp synthase/HD superfamily hydrolase